PTRPPPTSTRSLHDALPIYERVLLSPHMITTNTGSGIGPAIELATEAVIAALRGEIPDRQLIFNPQAVPLWTRRFAGQSLLQGVDRKSTRLNSSHQIISYAV